MILDLEALVAQPDGKCRQRAGEEFLEIGLFEVIADTPGLDARKVEDIVDELG